MLSRAVCGFYMNPYFLIAIGSLFLASKARAASPAFQRERDLDALASMIIAETDFARDRNEMAQIMFVAINRAKKYGYTIEEVATPPGKPVWNGGVAYRERFDDAPSSSRWPAARVFAAQVLSGQLFRNSGALAFVHPSGMPAPPCSSSRVATNTIAGTRCLPQWAVNGKVIGGAMFA